MSTRIGKLPANVICGIVQCRARKRFKQNSKYRSTFSRLNFILGSLTRMQFPIGVALNAGFNIFFVSDFKRHVYLIQTVTVNIK